MVLALLILAPVAGIAICIYVRQRPRPLPGKAKQLLLFETLVLLSIIAAGALELLHFKHALEFTVDKGWWPVLTVLAWLVTLPALLLLAGILRRLFFR